MPRLMPIHWKKFECFLIYVGCEVVREKGDHRIYARSDLKRVLVVPRYTPLPIFIIKNNLRLLGVSTEEYMEVLKRI